ncbi:MAG: hypothetical protein QOG68_2229 [Solirubrobacteraceae bacterium]|nr:hypothetical protein [Solirubrobacteraceae bacterium]
MAVTGQDDDERTRRQDRADDGDRPAVAPAEGPRALEKTQAPNIKGSDPFVLAPRTG